MKTLNCLFPVLAVCIVAFAGCKKEDPAKAAAQAYHGINVDWVKLDAVFATAGQETQDNITLVKRFFRYAQFPQALIELDKLSNNPNLTEPQKKLVTDLFEQTKKAIENTPAPEQ